MRGITMAFMAYGLPSALCHLEAIAPATCMAV